MCTTRKHHQTDGLMPLLPALAPEPANDIDPVCNVNKRLEDDARYTCSGDLKIQVECF